MIDCLIETLNHSIEYNISRWEMAAKIVVLKRIYSLNILSIESSIYNLVNFTMKLFWK